MALIDKSLAIIGSAGRQSDAARMSAELYAAMCSEARTMVRDHGVRWLVSGGAAFADHVAITLFLEGSVPNLTLFLPAPWDSSAGRYVDRGDGRTANFYHAGFAEKTGVAGLKEIGEANKGGGSFVVGQGFKHRNTLVASSSAMVLAFTFGAGSPTKDWEGGTPAIMAGLKPGGTSDTWAKASHASVKRHADLGRLEASLRASFAEVEDPQGPSRSP